VPVPRRFDRQPPERDPTRINERIRAAEVRLIDEDGSQIGVVGTDNALKMAHERDLDLVEVAPQSRPPVARLLDYSKYYNTKKGHVERFLRGRNKVKVTIMFRGREQAHPERGRALLQRLFEDLGGLATIEQQPLQEGRNMHMMLAPVRDGSGRGREQPAGGEATAAES
jgi:translation initiation factor IF-3